MIAAIDIGSNSVRLLLLHLDKKVKRSTITRLSEGVADSGLLRLDAIKRTVRAIKKYVLEAVRCRAEHIYIVATEAVRRADNASDFILAVKDAVGLDIEILSGDSEAMIGFLGAADLGTEAGTIDIGGASSEVALCKGEEIVSKSIPVGKVVLTEACGQSKEDIFAYLDNIINYDFSAQGKTFYAIGGTAATLAAMDASTDYSESLHGHILTMDRLKQLVDMIFSYPVSKRNFAGLSRDRRDVIGAGAAILLVIMQRLGLSEVTYSDNGLLEGYVKYKVYYEDRTGVTGG